MRDEILFLFGQLRSQYPKDDKYIVLSTSYAPSGLNSEGSDMLPYKNFVMTSWKLCQYEQALNTGLIFPGVSLDQLYEKYCYAGGSMRLMLRSIESTRKFLNEKLARVTNVKDLLSGLSWKMFDRLRQFPIAVL